MRTQHISSIAIAFALVFFPLQASIGQGAGDTDGDGVPDIIDNCTLAANGPLLGLSDPNGLYYVPQEDADDDGYGNACDCDYDNDGGCGLDDAIFLLGQFYVVSPSTAQLDINSDGAPGLDNLVITIPYWGGEMGPSGLACAEPNEKGTCPPEWF